jgi:hypothetical protein
MIQLMPKVLTHMHWRTASAATALALLLATFIGAWPSHAAPGVDHSAIGRSVIAVDWQGPLSLPPRFRNHCHYDANHGAWYCADHCGIDDQFYFCSPASFGCCRIGYGYCDWKGRLRCAP